MRIAVLVSGTGTILEALLGERLPVTAVLADRACPALARAERSGVEAVLVERDSFGPGFDREGYSKRVAAELDARAIDLVGMAGFGTVLAAPMHEAYGGRILNTHPALLPSFPGWHAVEDALAYGVKVTGCTVHVAGAEVDTGPILAQEAVPVLADDTVTTLHERIKEVERRLYPRTIHEILERGSVLPAPAETSDEEAHPT